MAHFRILMMDIIIALMGKTKQHIHQVVPFIGLIILRRVPSDYFNLERKDSTSAKSITTKERFSYSLRRRATLSVEQSRNSCISVCKAEFTLLSRSTYALSLTLALSWEG